MKWLPEDAELMLAGPVSPSNAAMIAETAARCGVAERVVVLGQLPPPEIESLMARASVLLLPSSEFEGFPIAVAEALASGLPVVATPVGALPDMVESMAGHAGVIVPSSQDPQLPASPQDVAEAVRRICGDPETWSAMSRSGRLRGESLRASTLVPRLEALVLSAAVGEPDHESI
jgi:glycosyltransferase involved in cell wall biosynthesis